MVTASIAVTKKIAPAGPELDTAQLVFKVFCLKNGSEIYVYPSISTSSLNAIKSLKYMVILNHETANHMSLAHWNVN